MSNLRLKAEELLNSEILCDCGKVHKANLPILIDESVVDCAKSLVGAGRVLIFSSKDVSVDFCDALHEEFEKNSFVVQRFLQNFDETTGIEVEEGTKLIVAIGTKKLIERAKLMAQRYRTKLIAVPLCFDFYKISMPQSALNYGGVRLTRVSRAPDKIIVKSGLLERVDDKVFGAILGSLYSKITAFIDYFYQGILSGEFCEDIVLSAFEAYKKINAIGFPRNSQNVKILIDCALKINAYLAFCGMDEGGESQLALTIERFIRENDRKIIPSGEILFLSSLIISKTYLKFLSTNTPFSVSDGFEDINQIQKVLSLGEGEIIRFITKGEEDYKYKDYKVSLMKDELKKLVEIGDDLLKCANVKLKRVYRDGAFHVRYFLTSTETLSLLSLSPFYTYQETLLSFMKERGLLNFNEKV